MPEEHDKAASERDAKNATAAYYDAVAPNYAEQYREDVLESGKKYPQNYFRLQMILRRLAEFGATSVYEVGTGEGTPLAMIAQAGSAVAGCDISEEMVRQTRARLQPLAIDESRIIRADIENTESHLEHLALGPFDAAIALGVMPHVGDDGLALRNMRAFVRPGGKVFVEFRNKLFSLFTFNRYTKEFILDDLLGGVSDDLREAVAAELDQRLAIDQPPIPTDESYAALAPKFHNPFEVPALIAKAGFENPRLHWYHWHPAPPLLEGSFKQRFWEEGARLEQSQNWRGHFLCSAFVVEADAV